MDEFLPVLFDSVRLNFRTADDTAGAAYAERISWGLLTQPADSQVIDQFAGVDDLIAGCRSPTAVCSACS